MTEQHYGANVECEMEYVCLCMEEAGGRVEEEAGVCWLHCIRMCSCMHECGHGCVCVLAGTYDFVRCVSETITASEVSQRRGHGGQKHPARLRGQFARLAANVTVCWMCEEERVRPQQCNAKKGKDRGSREGWRRQAKVKETHG